MKLTQLFLVPVLALVTAGCTVNHYHYNNAPVTAPQAQDIAGHKVLGEKLKGIHAAMEIIANNLANADTHGYKSRRITFHEGKTMPATYTDWTLGSAIESPSDLALYISGQGFFQIEVLEDMGGGIAYTRAGDFFLSRDGELVLGHADGERLAGVITFPSDTVSINVSSAGIVHAVLPDNSIEEVGRIELFSFTNPQGLGRGRNGFYFETEHSGPAIAGTPGEGVLGTLAQGYLEGSNVCLVSEMVELTKLTSWSNTIHRQLELPTMPLPPLDIPAKDGQKEERLVTWLHEINARPQAAP